MLQFLVCSDVHTYSDNIRLALQKLDRTDAILIAGDLEAEQSEILDAAGSIPCYAVCGNNDYYLNSDYPEELLIDIADHAMSSEHLTSGPSLSSEDHSPSPSLPPEHLTSSPSLSPGDHSTGLFASSEDQTAGYSLSSEDHTDEHSLSSADQPAGLSLSPYDETGTSQRYPRIEKVTVLQYSSLPSGYNSVPSIFKKIAPPSLLGKFAGDKRKPNISHRILMTHGKEYNVPNTDLLSHRADMWDADIVIFGHTHKFADIREKNGKRLFLNPGCLVGDPKATVRNWGLYEICSFSVLKIGFDGEISFQHLYL